MKLFSACASIAILATFASVAAVQAGGSLNDVATAVHMAWYGVYVGVQATYNAANADGKWGSSGATILRFDVLDLEGLGASGQIGHNHRVGSLVIGVEADCQGLDVADSKLDNESTLVRSAPSMRPDISLSFLASVRGCVGYSHNNNSPIYGSVGIGQITSDFDLRQSTIRTSDPAYVPLHVRLEEAALVYGGGVEWLFGKNLTLKIECLRFDVDANRDLSNIGFDADAGDHIRLGAIHSV